MTKSVGFNLYFPRLKPKPPTHFLCSFCHEVMIRDNKKKGRYWRCWKCGKSKPEKLIQKENDIYE